MANFKQQAKQLGLGGSLLLLAGSVCAEQAETARYIVQLRSPSTFRQLRAQFMNAMKASTIDSLGRVSVPEVRVLDSDARISDSMENFNMLVVESTADEIAALKNNPEVALVEQERFFPAPKVPAARKPKPTKPGQSNAPTGNGDIPWGITAVKAPDAWNTANYGQGARVVVLDTGVDKDHPAIKDNFEAGKNFVTSRMEDQGSSLTPHSILDFANLFASNTGATSGAPAPYPFFDQVGHGTHVSGTILGSGVGVYGVAPRAKLLMGRVCGKLGCSTIGVVNGLNWAVQQAVDVVSMSLGGPQGSDAEHNAIDAVFNAGIVPVAASGNDGTPEVSFPAAFSNSVAVGAIDSKLKLASFSQYGPELAVVAPGVDVKSSIPQGTGRDSKVAVGGKDVPSTSFVGAPEVETPVTGTLVDCGLGNTADFTAAVKGKGALIQRGVIPFADKVKNAIAAGASAAVIYNNAEGLINGALTQDGSTVAIPVVMIEQTVGEAVKADLAAGKSAQIQFSTVPSDYASFQGTSMATPHVSGVVALIKATNKNLSAAQVRDILTKTATALGPNDKNQFGAGLVNAQAATAAAKAAIRLR